MTFMDLRNKFISVVYFSQPGLGTVAAAVYFFGGGGAAGKKQRFRLCRGTNTYYTWLFKIVVKLIRCVAHNYVARHQHGWPQIRTFSKFTVCTLLEIATKKFIGTKYNLNEMETYDDRLCALAA